MHLSHEKKNAALHRILNSTTFSSSRTSRKLLEFLFQCVQKNEMPKETTIAIEVFGKSSHHNPSEDPVVRVAVHKLRNRFTSVRLKNRF